MFGKSVQPVPFHAGTIVCTENIYARNVVSGLGVQRNAADVCPVNPSVQLDTVAVISR